MRTTQEVPIRDLAKVRTKNVSPFEFTIDLLCHDQGSYDRLASQSNALLALVTRLYGVSLDECEYSAFGPALAIKITLPRRVPAGDPGDWDLFGAAQTLPLQEATLTLNDT